MYVIALKLGYIAERLDNLKNWEKYLLENAISVSHLQGPGSYRFLRWARYLCLHRGVVFI